MDLPLVSVICVNYNQGEYIEEAVSSVFNQSYKNIELIIVDDNSEDSSKETINKIKTLHPEITILMLETNSGICKAFNSGFRKSKGEYIIDLAGDDVLLPGRIQEGIEKLQEKGIEYGINFTNAAFINKSSQTKGYYFKINNRGITQEHVPEGGIYKDLLEKYIICAPTMMTRRSVFEDLNGYDETLLYEDFDFWVRSAKITKYCFSNKILVQKRIHPNSLSTHQYKKNSQLLISTYEVCLKAELLNETELDRKALITRVQYELKKALQYYNWKVATKFSQIIIRNTNSTITKICCSGLKSALSLISGYRNP
jgi:glycosyltransferase involved in cell wall biosynthesis